MRTLALALLLLVLPACYPGGYTEAEWNALTPEQQHEIRLKQLDADKARSDAAAARARKLSEVLRYDYEAQQRPLQNFEDPIETGDVVIVAFVSGTIRTGGTRVTFRPAVYEVWRGQSREVMLRPDPGFDAPPVLFTVLLPESARELRLEDGSREPIVLPRQRWEDGYLYRTSDATSDHLQPVDLTVFVRVKRF